MKILFLAPQPFFQERGTPIAVRMALEVIARRLNEAKGSCEIDLLCYHEGSTPEIPGVTVHRIRPCWPFKDYLKKIGAGISIKKLICDFFFLIKAFSLVHKSRNARYQLVHAVEESVFIAIAIKFIYKIPYLYDMDSSLAMQVIDRWTWLKPLHPVLRWLEGEAVRHSMAVAPVCDALGVIADGHGSKHTVLLRDVSLLKDSSEQETDLRVQAGLPSESKLMIYIGNLEQYQGIDLMIDSFKLVADELPGWAIVVIGGSERDIAAYSAKVKKAGLEEKIKLIGPRPVSRLASYIRQADILVSPRVNGNNTPMKIYSYLHSNRAILATRLQTHTQVLDDGTAMLAAPEAGAFAAGMKQLAADETLRHSLAEKAFEIAEKNYTFEVFSRELNGLYNRIEQAAL